jgi:hypothetical protein
MGRLVWIALGLLTACEQHVTLVDPGSLCIANSRSNFLGPADVVVGEPLPLMVTTGIGCSGSQVTAECMVDMVDNEAIISSVFEISTPGRLPWEGQRLCAGFFSVECEMPPAVEGLAIVHYGTQTMPVTAPRTGAHCIEAEIWTPQE